MRLTRLLLETGVPVQHEAVQQIRAVVRGRLAAPVPIVELFYVHRAVRVGAERLYHSEPAGRENVDAKEGAVRHEEVRHALLVEPLPQAGAPAEEEPDLVVEVLVP